MPVGTCLTLLRIAEKEEKRTPGESMRRKSLRKRLVESHVRSEAQEAASRLAVFLEYWAETEKSFRDGWSYKDVWRILKRDGDIDFSYSAFLNYIRKIKRRRLEHGREKSWENGGGTAGDGEIRREGRPTLRKRTPEPGSTKMELPRFGKETPPREPRRF
jgi:hypothetical protein